MQLVFAGVVGVLVALVTYVLVSPGSDEYEARARGALTTEVQWPFFDAVREEQRLRLEDPAVQADIEEAVGVELIALSTDLPRSQVFIDVTARTGDAGSAAAAANAAVAELVRADTEQLEAGTQAELDAAQARLDAIGEPVTDAERSEADRLVRLITDYELALVDIEPRLQVLEEAGAPTEPVRDPLAWAAIAGMVGFFVALVAVRWAVGRHQPRPPEVPAGDRTSSATSTSVSLAEREEASAGARQ